VIVLAVNEEGFFLDGIFYRNEDIDIAIADCGLDSLMVLLIVDSTGFEGLINTLKKHGHLPDPHRSNDVGHLVYPVFIAREIWAEFDRLQKIKEGN
jgi:hypothetical protein